MCNMYNKLVLQESINAEYFSSKYCEIWLVYWCIYMKQLERDAVLATETKTKGKVTLWTVLLLIAFCPWVSPVKMKARIGSNIVHLTFQRLKVHEVSFPK